MLDSMECPEDAVRLAPGRLGIGGGRVWEGMGWSVAAEEVPAVGDAAGGQC